MYVMAPTCCRSVRYPDWGLPLLQLPLTGSTVTVGFTDTHPVQRVLEPLRNLQQNYIHMYMYVCICIYTCMYVCIMYVSIFKIDYHFIFEIVVQTEFVNYKRICHFHTVHIKPGPML
jgi:hypothetical protein